MRRPEELQKDDKKRREDVWKKKNEEKHRRMPAMKLIEDEGKKRLREERRKKESRAERSRRSNEVQSGEFLRSQNKRLGGYLRVGGCGGDQRSSLRGRGDQGRAAVYSLIFESINEPVIIVINGVA